VIDYFFAAMFAVLLTLCVWEKQRDGRDTLSPCSNSTYGIVSFSIMVTIVG